MYRLRLVSIHTEHMIHAVFLEKVPWSNRFGKFYIFLLEVKCPSFFHIYLTLLDPFGVIPLINDPGNIH